MTQQPETALARVATPLAAALAMAAVMLFAPQALNDGDTWWHMATGAWILAHGRVPDHDVFSYSMAGHPWVAHEWLSEALMALAARVAGWSGVVILFAAVAGGSAWMLARRLARDLGGLTLIVTATLSLACMGGSLLVRPHLFMLPLLLAWTLEMLAARDENRPPRLAFALLMTLWANLHGSYVFGFVVAGAFGLEALAAPGAERMKVLRDWGLFGLASLACAVVTPHGPQALLFPFQLMTMTVLPQITEWRAQDFSHVTPFMAALLATLFVCLGRGVKVPPIRLLLLLALLFMALQHVRHQLVLVAIAPLLLARPLAEALGHDVRTDRTPRAWLVGFGVACLALAGLRLALPLQRGDGLNSPVTALDSVPADLKARPVLNGYGLGGYLIYKGVRPFIDGRADMYGDAFSAAYFAAVSPDPAALEKLARDHRVAWTIFTPDDPAVAALDANPAWRRIHVDRQAVVHARVGPYSPGG
ncbi:MULTISPECIES: hypothetical protein [unclassified Caulobacter]|uniref:hypothetical protein n=1 Tax=unclassified Caulobacter TaxID=2648921 RepID=UPI0006FBC567|nr:MULTISPECIES: hypothetical protein [unclassified Caulobacter]KQV56028.1 hypothetical protein ASC62_19130 [Caulobacter sp. Root342]KQV70798.1 hypothetical protein ASC70_04125 [Caulobacter sp. Root343]